MDQLSPDDIYACLATVDRLVARVVDGGCPPEGIVVLAADVGTPQDAYLSQTTPVCFDAVGTARPLVLRVVPWSVAEALVARSCETYRLAPRPGCIQLVFAGPERLDVHAVQTTVLHRPLSAGGTA